MHSRSLLFLLLSATAAPLVYFGAQAVAAPFFPDYSVLTVSASDLGSEQSSCPAILNTGAVVTGILNALGSVGLALALPRLGTPKALAWVLAACVASIGAASIWAGLHPLPHPDHDPGALGIGMFVAPFASALAAWKTERLHPLRWLLLFNLAAFGVCAWVLSGMAGVSLPEFGGLAQKLVAAVCFLPPAVIAILALKRL